MTFNTINTIVSDLLNIIRSSNISASETISKRQVEDWVHQYRAKLIKQDVDKGKIPNPDYIQQIDNLELVSVNEAGETILTGIESDWYVLRTNLELPKTLDFNFKSGFTFIGTPEGYEIQYVPETRSKWQVFKKYTNRDMLCYLRNGYIYITSPVAIKYITVRGIFEVPTEVSRFVNSVTNQPSANIDSKYPIPSNMIPTLKQMILSTELQIEMAAPTDQTNDSAANPQQVITQAQ